MKRTTGEKVFDIFNTVLLLLIGLTTLLPFLHLIAKSSSGEIALIRGLVTFYPIDFQVSTYKYVISDPQFLRALQVSLFVTVVGALTGVCLTVLTAYPLSKPKLKGRKFFLIMHIIVMLFSGGLVPNYLLYNSFGMLNTIWVLIVPMLLGTYNILLVKNFMEQLPESVEESARIDGANNMRVLYSIVVPMCMPVIATITLFTAVGYWNSYFTAVLYITDTKLMPLAQYMFKIVKESVEASKNPTMNVTDLESKMNIRPEAVQATTIVVSTVPILILYPFLQKYFVKGIIIGSVKG